MSLIPLLFDDSRWAPSCHRRQPVGQGFLEDILQPLAIANSLLQYPEFMKEIGNINADLQQQRGSITLDKDKFQANFDVQHFKPEEISVKVVDDTVTVEAKHEEKQDEHGQIYRHFVRKYVLPKNCDINRLESKLSSDGVLTISAPAVEDKTQSKTIPIAQTGKPAMSIKEKKDDKEKKQ